MFATLGHSFGMLRKFNLYSRGHPHPCLAFPLKPTVVEQEVVPSLPQELSG